MKGIAALFIAAFVAVSHAANQCPVEQETDWSIELLLVHGDCDKFYKCTYGVPVEQFCPAGLFFNTELLQCDWRSNVDCSDRNVPGEAQPGPEPEHKPKPEPEHKPKPEPEHKPKPEPEHKPKPEPEHKPKPEPEHKPKPEPEHKPKPEPEHKPKPEPEHKPKPEPEHKPKPEPEHKPKPEPENKPEHKPEHKPKPEPEKPEIEEIIPEEPELEVEEGSGDDEYPIEFQENGCPINPFIHWLVASSEDCSVFYQCVWGEPVYKRCSASLHFNAELQVCDWPNNAGCALSHNKHAPAGTYRK